MIPLPTADELLSEVEPLPFGRRCRHLADLRAHAGTAGLRDLLAELGSRGHYARSAALFIAAATRDDASRELIVRMLSDPASDLAAMAVALATRTAPPERIEALLDDAPAAVRSVVYRAIRKHRLTALAERIIDGVAQRWGETEAAGLLHVCGERMVRERLAPLAHAVPNWAAFGAAHPDPVLDHAEAELAAAPELQRNSCWLRYKPGVAAAAPERPERVIGLLERVRELTPLRFFGPLPALLRADLPRMLDLLLDEPHREHFGSLLSSHALRRRVALCDRAPEAAAAIGDRAELAGFLKAAPPARRAALLDAALSGVERAGWQATWAVLDVLPHAAQTREARRMLGLRRVAGNLGQQRELTAYLPMAEADPVFTELIRSADAEERGTGYRLLITCAARSRDPRLLGDVLDDRLNRLRNEQDPVRHSAIVALASVPVSLLRTAHGPALAKITTDALDSRDVSYGTRQGLTNLAAALLRQGATSQEHDLLPLAFDLVHRLTDHRGTMSLPRLDLGLPRGREHAIGAEMAQYLRRAGMRDDHRLTFALARALHRRADQVVEIQEALGRAALDARDDGVIRQAIDLWLRPQATRGERVGRIVERDPSTVLLHPVLEAIATRRTDLLHLVLDGDAQAGRFRHPQVRYVPRIDPRWTRRWTGTQQATYIALLHHAARRGELPDAERSHAVGILGRVAGVTVQDLRPYYLGEGGEDLLTRVAITSVVWVPTPAAVLRDLLDLASSDRAHVAMAAASRAARFVAPSTLTAELGPVLTDGKITARKEALRILLRNHAPNALEVIETVWDTPGQHPDVRVAIVSAVRDRIADPIADRILHEAARGTRDEARQLLAARPHLVPGPQRPRLAALILEVAATTTDQRTGGDALHALSTWAGYDPAIEPFLAAGVADLEAADATAWRTALHALLACARTEYGAQHLVAAVRRLAGQLTRFAAEPERDLPAWQRLTPLTGQLRVMWTLRRQAHYAGLVAELAEILPEPLASELVAAAIRWESDDVTPALEALAARPLGGALATERVARALAHGSAGVDLGPPSPWAGLPQPEVILPHAAWLAARGDLPTGLFACALTSCYGERAGWAAPWRALLRTLRGHPHPDVRYLATTTHIAQE